MCFCCYPCHVSVWIFHGIIWEKWCYILIRFWSQPKNNHLCVLCVVPTYTRLDSIKYRRWVAVVLWIWSVCVFMLSYIVFMLDQMPLSYEPFCIISLLPVRRSLSPRCAGELVRFVNRKNNRHFMFLESGVLKWGRMVSHNRMCRWRQLRGRERYRYERRT